WHPSLRQALPGARRHRNRLAPRATGGPPLTDTARRSRDGTVSRRDCGWHTLIDELACPVPWARRRSPGDFIAPHLDRLTAWRARLRGVDLHGRPRDARHQ